MVVMNDNMPFVMSKFYNVDICMPSADPNYKNRHLKHDLNIIEST